MLEINARRLHNSFIHRHTFGKSLRVVGDFYGYLSFSFHTLLHLDFSQRILYKRLKTSSNYETFIQIKQAFFMMAYTENSDIQC